jgi:hypothetical protein
VTITRRGYRSRAIMESSELIMLTRRQPSPFMGPSLRTQKCRSNAFLSI